MRPLIPLLLTFTAAAQADRLVSWQRRLNLTLLEFESGAGEIEIINPSTFRFVRCRSKPCAGRTPAAEPVTFRVVDTESAFEFRTSYIEIRVRKHDGGLMVKSRHGVEMLDEIVPPGPAPAGLNFSRRSPDGERLYGLGPRTDRGLDLKGKVIATKRPLLISSLGFGLWFTASSDYSFDLRSKVSIHAPFPDRLEFYFHYGPTPKEILEENYAVTGWSFAPTPVHAGVLIEPTVPRYANKVDMMPLPDLLAWLSHASMSGLLVPAFEQTKLPPALAPLMPMIYGGPPSKERESLRLYLYTYLMEAKDRGFPLFRPMAMQYSKDVEAAARLDQFMLGDELLVAAGKEIYLPMGIWTDMRTGAVHKGKQTFPVGEAPGLPIYAKNGTIVPLLQPDGTLQLHYMPRLGAEFFISEPGDTQPSQVHAGPAAGVLRLEIESRVDRKYEWIVYHVSPAVSPVARYDAALKRLHIPVEVKAMKGSIINVTLETPLEP
jgi:hypothetical protein